MRDWILVSVLAMVGCGGGGDGEGSGDSRSTRCARMRDRVVELSLADAAGVDGDPHRAAMRRALGPELVRACERSMTDGQIACVLGAADPAAAQACTTGVNR